MHKPSLIGHYPASNHTNLVIPTAGRDLMISTVRVHHNKMKLFVTIFLYAW